MKTSVRLLSVKPEDLSGTTLYDFLQAPNEICHRMEFNITLQNCIFQIDG